VSILLLKRRMNEMRADLPLFLSNYQELITLPSFPTPYPRASTHTTPHGADDEVMGCLGRQVQPVAGLEGEELLGLGQMYLQRAGDDPQNPPVGSALVVMNVPGLGLPGVRLQPLHCQ
jgi:hypothetical protein